MTYPDGWTVVIERDDYTVRVRKSNVPNDELEYVVDTALREARDLETRNTRS